MSLTSEQQEIRSKGIGGSEIAAVCGLNPHMRPIDVYLTKIGAAQFKGNFHTERGTFLEPGFIKWYQHRFKREKIEFPGTLVHKKHKLVIATPDAVADSRYVVEIKAPNWRTAHEWGSDDTDEIPDYYLPQTQWEMAVTGLKRADVIAFMDGNIRRFCVEYDSNLFAALLERAEQFWRDHVIPRKPPPEDGSESYSGYLETVFRKSDEPREENNTPEFVALIEQYRRACEQLDAVATRKSQVRQSIEKVIGNHSGIHGDWGSISYKFCKDRIVTDHEAICNELDIPAALLKKYTEKKPGYRTFRPNFKKNKEQ